MVFPSKKKNLLTYLLTSLLTSKHSEKDTKKHSFLFISYSMLTNGILFVSKWVKDSYVGGCLHNILASYLNKRKAIHSLFALELMNRVSKKFTTGVSLPIFDFCLPQNRLYYRFISRWQNSSVVVTNSQ